MSALLEQIHDSRDLQRLGMQELELLASEIRTFLIAHVSETGGHLSSNLGTVELTLALHKVFDVSCDKIIWDVGHQSYTHKILTGRKDLFDTLRSMDGISGFPKTEENPADAFNTGHSSTSISAALGIAKANELRGCDGRAVAVIGDGALTGGMAFEALNHAGSSRTPLVVILNDNGMSISRNVGGLSRHLKNMRNNKKYFVLKDDVKRTLDKVPLIGAPLKKLLHHLKKDMKKILVQNGIFEDLGMTYMGPVDGHNIQNLITVLNRAKELNEPVLVHIHTVKGKGYSFAEQNPDVFHGVGAFDPATGLEDANGALGFSDLFGKVLCDLAQENTNIAAVTAAMPAGTGLMKFSALYPERFFDVGIAEQHAVTFSAGLAKAGMIPVFAVYSSFLQRGYDQLIHDVALQKLHVVFAIDRAGAVGKDGETHQGIYDLSYLAHIPGMTILAPSCAQDFEQMLHYAVCECDGPVAVRYPRGSALPAQWRISPLRSGKGSMVREGGDVLLIAVGTMVQEALAAADLLQKENISAGVLDARFIKPLDIALIQKQAEKYRFAVTIEDNSVIGGFGSMVRQTLEQKVLVLGYPDEPVKQGTISELRKKYGIDAEGIAAAVQAEAGKTAKVLKIVK